MTKPHPVPDGPDFLDRNVCLIPSELPSEYEGARIRDALSILADIDPDVPFERENSWNHIHYVSTNVSGPRIIAVARNEIAMSNVRYGSSGVTRVCIHSIRIQPERDPAHETVIHMPSSILPAITFANSTNDAHLIAHTLGLRVAFPDDDALGFLSAQSGSAPLYSRVFRAIMTILSYDAWQNVDEDKMSAPGYFSLNRTLPSKLFIAHDRGQSMEIILPEPTILAELPYMVAAAVSQDESGRILCTKSLVHMEADGRPIKHTDIVQAMEATAFLKRLADAMHPAE